jgi:hypothetical protein
MQHVRVRGCAALPTGHCMHHAAHRLRAPARRTFQMYPSFSLSSAMSLCAPAAERDGGSGANDRTGKPAGTDGAPEPKGVALVLLRDVASAPLPGDWKEGPAAADAGDWKRNWKPGCCLPRPRPLSDELPGVKDPGVPLALALAPPPPLLLPPRPLLPAPRPAEGERSAVDGVRPPRPRPRPLPLLLSMLALPGDDRAQHAARGIAGGPADLTTALRSRSQ